ncbi:MAG TPA: NfeD family protein [bacterium]|nr:NfeD family protein [bacterium]
MNTIVLLFAAGVLLVCAEIFLPGVICGIIGTGCLISSVVMCYAQKGAQFGSYYLAAVVAITGIAIYIAAKLFPRTKMGKSLMLQSSEINYASAKDYTYLLDKTGLAISYLRPAGIVEIDGERIDVVSEGDYIDRGTKIKVIAVEGHRIVVRKTE